MKLTYRGVSYDHTPNPVPNMNPAFATGTYRGAVTEFHTLSEVPEQPGADLTWRGVVYRSGNMASPELAAAESTAVAMTPSTPEETPTPGVTALARNLFIRRHQRARRREQGMMVRLAAEVGIPVDEAAQYESHIQGKLPHDFSAYDRSATAMS